MAINYYVATSSYYSTEIERVEDTERLGPMVARLFSSSPIASLTRRNKSPKEIIGDMVNDFSDGFWQLMGHVPISCSKAPESGLNFLVGVDFRLPSKDDYRDLTWGHLIIDRWLNEEVAKARSNGQRIYVFDGIHSVAGRNGDPLSVYVSLLSTLPASVHDLGLGEHFKVEPKRYDGRNTPNIKFVLETGNFEPFNFETGWSNLRNRLPNEY